MVYSYRCEEGIISKTLSRHLLHGFLGALADICIGFLAVLLLLRYLSGSHSSLFIVVISFTRTIMGIVDNTSENGPFSHESLSYPASSNVGSCAT